MNLDRALGELGMEDDRNLLAAEWALSQRTLPDGTPEFLSPDFVAEACQATLLPDDIKERAVAAASRVAATPALRALAWHCQWRLYRDPDGLNWSTVPLPSMVDVDGDRGIFYLLVLLSRFGQMRSIYQSLSLPEQVVRDCMGQIYERGGVCSRRLSVWGLDAGAVRWLSNYLRGEIFLLGRLAYQFWVFEDPVRVYRHVDTSQVIALSEGNVRYGDDGQLSRKDAATDWTARLSETPREVVGNPIFPSGHAVREVVRLSAGEWRQILGDGDPVLSFHIPDEGRLDHEECDTSFREAMTFFPRFFPERPVRAFYCFSWLLDTQLEDWLPSTSNLVRFLQEFYLFPGDLSEDGLLGAVLGGRPKDLAQALLEEYYQLFYGKASVPMAAFWSELEGVRERFAAAKRLATGPAGEWPNSMRTGSQWPRRSLWTSSTHC